MAQNSQKAGPKSHATLEKLTDGFKATTLTGKYMGDSDVILYHIYAS